MKNILGKNVIVAVIFFVLWMIVDVIDVKFCPSCERFNTPGTKASLLNKFGSEKDYTGSYVFLTDKEIFGIISFRFPTQDSG